MLEISVDGENYEANDGNNDDDIEDDYGEEQQSFEDDYG